MKNLKFQIAIMPNCEAAMKRVFLDILADYCYRFNVLPTEKKVTIGICTPEYFTDDGPTGTTFISDDGTKILIQVRDPYMSEWEDSPWVDAQFLNILCHEIIHACQHLTGREGFSMGNATYDKEDPIESYYFEKQEVEARALADFYRHVYAHILK